MQSLIKIVMTLLIAVLGAGGALYVKSHVPNIPQRQAFLAEPPLVEIKKVVLQDSIAIPVYSRGEVSPRSQIQLSLEVPGSVVHQSPNLVDGGFFNKGDVLVRIDDQPYRLRVTKAKAAVAAARRSYHQIEAEVSLDEQIEGLPAPVKHRQEQLEEALAQLAASEADLALARMQLNKTQLVAPFDGRVRQATVGQGQYVTAGLALAKVYEMNVVEVRLPLSDRQLALLELFEGEPTRDTAKIAPKVLFKWAFGNDVFYWHGQIVRTEASLHTNNRLLFAIAQINDPYQKDPAQPGRPPLASGQFLEAKIVSHRHQQIAVLPRSALRYGREIWLVINGKLQQREVRVLHKDRDNIYVSAGLRRGEQIVVSSMEAPIVGMLVRVASAEEPLLTVSQGPSL